MLKIKAPFLLLLGLVFISLYINSCKKDNSGSIQTLFTGGSWQLASLLVYHYVGGNVVSMDTLNTACDTTQLFTFHNDNTCTYTNFDCLTQKTATGMWSLSSNQLNLLSTISCQDTLAGGGMGTTKPFANALILNLGLYSLVLETGDINTYYTATTIRTITEYGFVRKGAAGN